MKRKEFCFADHGSSCGILQELVCRKGPCPFYKTQAERQRELVARKKRLKSLPDIKQQRVSWLYFKKRYPWLSEVTK